MQSLTVAFHGVLWCAEQREKSSRRRTESSTPSCRRRRRRSAPAAAATPATRSRRLIRRSQAVRATTQRASPCRTPAGPAPTSAQTAAPAGRSRADLPAAVTPSRQRALPLMQPARTVLACTQGTRMHSREVPTDWAAYGPLCQQRCRVMPAPGRDRQEPRHARPFHPATNLPAVLNGIQQAGRRCHAGPDCAGLMSFLMLIVIALFTL